MTAYHQNIGNQSVGYNNASNVYASAPYEVSCLKVLLKKKTKLNENEFSKRKDNFPNKILKFCIIFRFQLNQGWISSPEQNMHAQTVPHAMQPYQGYVYVDDNMPILMDYDAPPVQQQIQVVPNATAVQRVQKPRLGRKYLYSFSPFKENKMQKKLKQITNIIIFFFCL